MTPAVTATGAAALMIACAAEVAAQTSAAISDTSIRPAEITCQELLSATEQERASIVYFIAGYQAAMEQVPGQPSSSANVTAGADTSETAGSGGTDQTSSDTGTSSSSGAAPSATDTAAIGDVMIARSFFAKPIPEVLKECEATGTGAENAGAVIKRAQGDTQ